MNISGSTAIAKLELSYPQTQVIDYLSLRKIKGEWRIAAKVVDARQK